MAVLECGLGVIDILSPTDCCCWLLAAVCLLLRGFGLLSPAATAAATNEPLSPAAALHDGRGPPRTASLWRMGKTSGSVEIAGL
eukprot:COSAG01_NODE_12723_length_1693_cov_6.143664_2_plen_84_part_00